MFSDESKRFEKASEVKINQTKEQRELEELGNLKRISDKSQFERQAKSKSFHKNKLDNYGTRKVLIYLIRNIRE